MKSNKSFIRVHCRAWATLVIVHVIAVCLLIMFTIVSKAQTNAQTLQSATEPKSSTAVINNCKAGRNIIIENSLKNDTTIKPLTKKSDSESSKGVNNIQSTITGDNNTSVQGNNNKVTIYNTTNKYGLEINNPKIYNLKVTNHKGKYILPYANYRRTPGDSLFKTTIDFKYSYQLRASQVVFNFENISQIKFIKFDYSDGDVHFNYGAYYTTNRNGDIIKARITNPVNGGMYLDLYSTSELLNLENKLKLSVDSFSLK